MSQKLRCRASLPFIAVLATLTSILSFTPAHAAGYSTANGRILGPDGREITLKGVNYAGFQQGSMNRRAPGWAGPYNVPSNLWEMNWKQQLFELRQLGFNALRIPVSPHTIHQTRTVDSYNASLVTFNPDIAGKRPLEVLDLVLAECAQLGLYVLLDMHQTSGTERNPTPYMLDPKYAAEHSHDGTPYTVEDWTNDLRFLATRYRSNPMLLGIDIFNEPHWHLRWDRGDRLFDEKAAAEPARYGYWKDLVERASAAIHVANRDILIFVEGMDSNYDVPQPRPDVYTGWSESFARLAYEEIDRGNAGYMNWPRDRIVLSPHSYGPDVAAHNGQYPAKFEAKNGFPGNLAAQWEFLFGRLAGRYPIVHGEFGGKLGAGQTGQRDIEWHDAFITYLHSKGIRSGFYWNFRNSNDTIDVVDRNYNVVSPTLMDTLRRLWGESERPTTPTKPPPSTSRPSTGSETVAVPRVRILYDPVSNHRRGRKLSGRALKRNTQTWIYVRTKLPVARAEFFRNGEPMNVDKRADLPGVFDFNSSYTTYSVWNFAPGRNAINVILYDAAGRIIGQGAAKFRVL